MLPPLKQTVSSIRSGKSVVLQNPLKTHIKFIVIAFLVALFGGVSMLLSPQGGQGRLFAIIAIVAGIAGIVIGVYRMFNPFQVYMNREGITLIPRKEFYSWKQLIEFVSVTGESNDQWVAFETAQTRKAESDPIHLWISCGVPPEELAEYMNEVRKSVLSRSDFR